METPEQCVTLFQVNNKYTRMVSMTSFSFLDCSGVSIVDPEQVKADWVYYLFLRKAFDKSNQTA